MQFVTLCSYASQYVTAVGSTNRVDQAQLLQCADISGPCAVPCPHVTVNGALLCLSPKLISTHVYSEHRCAWCVFCDRAA